MTEPQARVDKLSKNSVLACACSGGIDSMAMTFLLSHHHKVIALIVDHSLRKESKQEAKSASNILTKLGIANHILTYKGKKPKANIQEEARNIRYSLLLDYCKQHGIKHLATAHNAEDNAETFLLRLTRGSGIDGLSAINPETNMNGVKIFRPVMHLPRKALKQLLVKNKVKWVEDPTNASDKYKRNKLRHMLSKLEDGDLITKRINDAATNIARARDFLNIETDKALKLCTKQNVIDIKKFDKLHDEIAFRLLAKLIAHYSKKLEKPRFETLKRLKSSLTEGKTMNLQGLIFRINKEKCIITVEK